MAGWNATRGSIEDLQGAHTRYVAIVGVECELRSHGGSSVPSSGYACAEVRALPSLRRRARKWLPCWRLAMRGSPFRDVDCRELPAHRGRRAPLGYAHALMGCMLRACIPPREC